MQQLPHRLNIAQLLLTAAAAAVVAVSVAVVAVAAAVIAAVGREGGHAEDGLKQCSGYLFILSLLRFGSRLRARAMRETIFLGSL